MSGKILLLSGKSLLLSGKILLLSGKKLLLSGKKLRRNNFVIVRQNRIGLCIPLESKIENLLKFNPVKDAKDSSDVQY